jgi:hypothetical protein
MAGCPKTLRRNTRRSAVHKLVALGVLVGLSSAALAEPEIAKDGLEDLVNKTGRENNNIRLADVTSGPLMDWMLTSGFTQEELVMIQWPTFAQDDPVGYARMIRRQREEERARKREDQRLAAGYLQTERALKQRVLRDAALDLAVARLAQRPDLVEELHDQTKTFVVTE